VFFIKVPVRVRGAVRIARQPSITIFGVETAESHGFKSHRTRYHLREKILFLNLCNFFLIEEFNWRKPAPLISSSRALKSNPSNKNKEMSKAKDDTEEILKIQKDIYASLDEDQIVQAIFRIVFKNKDIAPGGKEAVFHSKTFLNLG
jgi:hypothetical protein